MNIVMQAPAALVPYPTNPRKIPDEAVDRLTMAGTADEVRKRLADYEGIVDEVICVNVFYSAGDQSSMLDAYRRLIHL